MTLCQKLNCQICNGFWLSKEYPDFCYLRSNNLNLKWLFLKEGRLDMKNQLRAFLKLFPLGNVDEQVLPKKLVPKKSFMEKTSHEKNYGGFNKFLVIEEK